MAIKLTDYAGATTLPEMLALIQQENDEFLAAEQLLVEVQGKIETLQARKLQLETKLAAREETPLWIRHIQSKIVVPGSP